MNLLKPRKIGTLYKPYSFKGNHYFSVAAMMSFNLQTGEIYPETDAKAQYHSLMNGHIFDLAMPKGSPEVIVMGSAIPPEPKKYYEVSVSIGDIQKAIKVIGNRKRKSPLGAIVTTEAFTRIPLDYEYTYGGKNSQQNPVGIGAGSPSTAPLSNSDTAKNTATDLPNLIPAYRRADGVVVSKSSKNNKIAALGPVGVDWPQKIPQAGSYNDQWLNQRYPGFPDDLDFHFFNRAAEDQQQVDPFYGGMDYELTGMHADYPTLNGQLPWVVFKCFYQMQNQKALNECLLDIDTVWFFPEQQLGVMIGRGTFLVQDSDGLDVASLLLAYEDSRHSPRDVKYYQEQLIARTDKEHALKHALNDLPLSPKRSDEQDQQAKSEREQHYNQRQQKSEAQQKALKDAINVTLSPSYSRAGTNKLDKNNADLNTEIDKNGEQERVTDQVNLAKQMTWQPPQLAADKMPTPDEMDRGEADLTGIMDYVQTVMSGCEQQALEIKEKAINEIEKGKAIKSASQKNNLFADKRNNNDDIKTIIKLAEQQVSIRIKPSDTEGMVDKDLDHQAKAEKISVFAANQAKIARLAETHSAPQLEDVIKSDILLAQALRSECSKLLHYHQKTRSDCLQGRDLSRADLSGFRFEGLDLSVCNFARTNLSNAVFVNCIFNGSSLSGALVHQVVFKNCKFDDANLYGVVGDDAQWLECELAFSKVIEADIKKSNWSGSVISNSDFIQCNLNESLWVHCTLAKVSFIKVSAQSSNLNRIKLQGANCQLVDFSQCTFDQSSFEQVSFSNVNAEAARFSSAYLMRCIALADCNFTGAKFKNATIEQSGFRGCNLSGAELPRAQIIKSDFGNANLSYSYLNAACAARSIFNNADLSSVSAKDFDGYSAKFKKANFTKSNLARANLWQAELTEMNCQDCDLTDVIMQQRVGLKNVGSQYL